MEEVKKVEDQDQEEQPSLHIIPSQTSCDDEDYKLLKRSYHARNQPSHPHYPQMVLEAIKELDEVHGSGEESIMKYIEETYRESRIFFKEVLKFNLKTLVDNKEIEVTHDSTYILAGQKDRMKIKKSEPRLASNPKLNRHPQPQQR